MNSFCLSWTGGFVAALLVLPFAGTGAQTQIEPQILESETFIHDPSTILKENDRYFVFGTGRGILTKSSTDLVHWTNGPAVFNTPPAWASNAVPGYHGHTWAPDAIHLNGQYYLYLYDTQSNGRSRLAIGKLRWTDDGWPEAETTSIPTTD